MNASQKNEIRSYLATQRTLLDGSHNQERLILENCADTNDYATLLTQHAMEMALRERQLRKLDDVERAIKRIELDDTFGVCQECGDDIGMARIKASPSTELCVQCQAEAERNLSRCA